MSLRPRFGSAMVFVFCKAFFWVYQDEVLNMGLMSCVGVEIEQHGIIDLLITVGCIAVY